MILAVSWSPTFGTHGVIVGYLKKQKNKQTSLACLTQLTSQPVCLSRLISALVIFSTITSITALHI